MDRRQRSAFVIGMLMLLLPVTVSATTRQQEICGRRTCTPSAITCPAATACQTLYADRVRSVCGLSAPSTLCLSNDDTTCLQSDACLSQTVGAGSTTPAPSSTGLCCRCQKAGKRVCIQNISDAGAATNCGNILQQSSVLRGLVSANAALFSDVSCENAPLNASQCRTVAQSGTCGGENFSNPPLVDPSGVVAALNAPTTTAPAATTQPERPFQSITPALGVPFPGLTLSPARKEGETVSIPFLAEYVAAGYKYGISIAMIAAMVMLIYGGFLYLTGSAFEDVSTAKKIIQDAIAGLMIVLGAYVILANVNPQTLELQTLELSNVKYEPFSNGEGLHPNDFVDVEAQDICIGSGRGASSGAGWFKLNLGRRPYTQAAGAWGQTAYGATAPLLQPGEPHYDGAPKCRDSDHERGCWTTFAAAGCGPTSLATVLAYFNVTVAGHVVTPLDTGRYAVQAGGRTRDASGNKGTVEPFLGQSTLNQYFPGLVSQSVSGVERIAAAIRAGHPLIFGNPRACTPPPRAPGGNSNGANCPGCGFYNRQGVPRCGGGVGHYMVLAGVKNDNSQFFVHDVGWGEGGTVYMDAARAAHIDFRAIYPRVAGASGGSCPSH